MAVHAGAAKAQRSRAPGAPTVVRARPGRAGARPACITPLQRRCVPARPRARWRAPPLSRPPARARFPSPWGLCGRSRAPARAGERKGLCQQGSNSASGSRARPRARQWWPARTGKAHAALLPRARNRAPLASPRLSSAGAFPGPRSRSRPAAPRAPAGARPRPLRARGRAA